MLQGGHICFLHSNTQATHRDFDRSEQHIAKTAPYRSSQNTAGHTNLIDSLFFLQWQQQQIPLQILGHTCSSHMMRSIQATIISKSQSKFVFLLMGPNNSRQQSSDRFNPSSKINKNKFQENWAIVWIRSGHHASFSSSSIRSPLSTCRGIDRVGCENIQKYLDMIQRQIKCIIDTKEIKIIIRRSLDPTNSMYPALLHLTSRHFTVSDITYETFKSSQIPPQFQRLVCGGRELKEDERSVVIELLVDHRFQSSLAKSNHREAVLGLRYRRPVFYRDRSYCEKIAGEKNSM
jgi:hypothetical protein